MSQTAYRDLEGSGDQGMCHTVTYHFDPSPLTPSPKLCLVDDPRNDPMTTSNQPLQGESNFGDSSGPLFFIYSKAAEEEDNKMVERWQKDADGILIFVRPCVYIHMSFHVNWNSLDWSILCRSRCSPCCYRPGPQA